MWKEKGKLKLKEKNLFTTKKRPQTKRKTYFSILPNHSLAVSKTQPQVLMGRGMGIVFLDKSLVL